jgi:hypothetical protein
MRGTIVLISLATGLSPLPTIGNQPESFRVAPSMPARREPPVDHIGRATEVLRSVPSLFEPNLGQWLSGVPGYRQVIASGAYPEIDVVRYANGRLIV